MKKILFMLLAFLAISGHALAQMSDPCTNLESYVKQIKAQLPVTTSGVTFSNIYILNGYLVEEHVLSKSSFDTLTGMQKNFKNQLMQGWASSDELISCAKYALACEKEVRLRYSNNSDASKFDVIFSTQDLQNIVSGQTANINDELDLMVDQAKPQLPIKVMDGYYLVDMRNENDAFVYVYQLTDAEHFAEWEDNELELHRTVREQFISMKDQNELMFRSLITLNKYLKCIYKLRNSSRQIVVAFSPSEMENMLK